MIEPHRDPSKPPLPDVCGRWTILDSGKLETIWDVSDETKSVAPIAADGNYLYDIAFEEGQLLMTDPLGTTSRLTRVGIEV